MHTEPSLSDKNEEEFLNPESMQQVIPTALPVEIEDQLQGDAIPMALAVEMDELSTSDELQVQKTATQEPSTIQVEVHAEPPSENFKVILCKVCGSQRIQGCDSCQDCGYYFTEIDLEGTEQSLVAINSISLGEIIVAGRYKAKKLVLEFGDLKIYEGSDTKTSGGDVTVWIYTQPEDISEVVAAPAEVKPAEVTAEDDFLPSFDDSLLSGTGSIDATREMPKMLVWPNLGWLRSTIDAADNLGLPKILYGGVENSSNFLVLEVAVGKDLWEIWDEESSNSIVKFGHLQNLARILTSLHKTGAFLEFVRPENVVLTADGTLKLRDLLEILPLPFAPGNSVKGTLYTPPELLAGKGCTSPRPSLYSFGALIYSLEILHRELSESDFEKPGVPKPFIPRFPDIHPAFGRLISKTFRSEIHARFPTDEAGREDASGFSELIASLATVGRALDRCRLEIASWTTTGMVRTGNEDAFALMHATESRQDDLADSALLFLADGMGGYEAGEVAAAMTMQILRQHLTLHKMFSQFAGGSSFINDAVNPPPKGESHGPAELDVEECKKLFKAALKDANKQIFTASRAPGSKRRGMGCTAEVAFIDGKNLVVGHVGDSRVYHLSQGELIQVTRDQTLVNRLVELGTITAEEAEDHPRKNELQQAIGGQPDTDPGIYYSRVLPGDWVFVCSDGLTNHISNNDLRNMLFNEATSAQMAARRLVNLANIEGATDNATVVVIRCS